MIFGPPKVHLKPYSILNPEPPLISQNTNTKNNTKKLSRR